MVIDEVSELPAVYAEGVWLPNYYKTVHRMAGGAANAMLTLFFLGALVVRMLSPLVYKRMS